MTNSLPERLNDYAEKLSKPHTYASAVDRTLLCKFLREAAAETERLQAIVAEQKRALQDAASAIEALDAERLGVGGRGETHWYLRDELLSVIHAALAKSNEATYRPPRPQRKEEAMKVTVTDEMIMHAFAVVARIDEQPVTITGDQMRRAIEAALAAQAPAALPDGWQPIETAPKDGTTILVSNGRLPYVAFYRREGWQYGRRNNILGFEPTHWMPLPAPPRKQKDEG